MKKPTRIERNFRPTSLIQFRAPFLFTALFCTAAALPLSHVQSSAAQITTANAPQSAAPTNGPSAQASSLLAQTSDAQLPSFEVAAIKKHVPDGGPGMRVSLGGPDISQFRASNVTAKMLIGTAYGVKEFQISGGPSWIGSERWDINAKVEDSLAADLQKLPRQQWQAQQALMLRSLLIDRFKLQVTRATKEGTVLALVAAKGGPKLKEVPAPDPQAGPPPPPPPAARGGAPPAPPPGSTMMMMNGTTGLATVRMTAAPIANLVNLLSLQTGQQVVDKTGLTGHYDVTLQFGSQGGFGGMPPPPPKPGDTAEPGPEPNSDAPSIFTALQDQLGLKLESSKGPVETITIDHIEEPSEN